MESQPIVRRVDRILVRVNDPAPIFRMLTEQLLLPVAWPIQANPIYVSGAVNLGNLILEVMQLGARNPSQEKARFAGIAFELDPYPTSLPQLEVRGIPHTPPMPFYQLDEQGWQVTTWTSVFLGGLIGDSATQKAFFRLSQRADPEVWEQGSLPNKANRRLSLPYIFDNIYRHGITYSVEYNAAWRASHVQSELSHAGLDVLNVFEVSIGVRDLAKSHACWKALLDPYPEIAENVWELPGGLHIHLVENIRDELLGMIWQVASLNRAAQYLHRHGLLADKPGEEIRIDPQKIHGLVVRLVQ